MLHTAMYLTALKPTQASAKRHITLALSLLKGGYQECEVEFANAVAKDAAGRVMDSEIGGKRICMVAHSLKGKSYKDLQADLKAFTSSVEFHSLGKFQTAQPKPEPTDVLDTMNKLRAMTVEDFGKFCEAAGIKATIDRGVWGVTMPGVKGQRYFDAQTGLELAAGEKAGDRKLTLDMRRDEGKLTYLCALVNNGRKLTAAQKDFVAICNEGGLTIPAGLVKLLPYSGPAADVTDTDAALDAALTK